MAQWLRIRLPMQGTRVRALVREDPTCRWATKPMRHNYWARALEHTSHNYWARMPQLLKPVHLELVLCNKRSHHMRSPRTTTKSSPLLSATRESPRAATKTQPSQKKKKKKKANIYYVCPVLGMLLHTLRTLSEWIPWGMYYCYPHFTDDSTQAQRC